jgi:hypothetical protein
VLKSNPGGPWPKELAGILPGLRDTNAAFMGISTMSHGERKNALMFEKFSPSSRPHSVYASMYYLASDRGGTCTIIHEIQIPEHEIDSEKLHAQFLHYRA